MSGFWLGVALASDDARRARQRKAAKAKRKAKARQKVVRAAERAGVLPPPEQKEHPVLEGIFGVIVILFVLWLIFH